MEPKFQSSFIPKKPISDSPKMMGPVTKNRNVFSTIATLLFVITMLASVGVFAYLKYIENNISSADKELSDVRNAFEADKIKDLINASSKLNSIGDLLEKHYVVSQLLVLLQNLTLKNMSFDNFTYHNLDSKPELTMESEAASYNAIANQKDVFVQSGLLEDVSFSSFSLSDTGHVKSKFSAKVSPKLVSYKEYIDSTLNPAPLENAQSTATSTINTQP